MKFFSTLDAIKIGKFTLGNILEAILVFLIGYIVLRIVLRILERAWQKSKLPPSLQGFVHQGVKIVLYVLLALSVVDAIGIPITSFVAIVSVASLALSLSLQKILENIFGGMSVLATKPFAVGDYVEANGMEGTVKEIGLSYTKLTTADNKVISVPNSEMAASKIINYSANKTRRVEICVGAEYGDKTEDVEEALRTAARRVAGVLQDPAPFVNIKEYRDSDILYMLRVWCNTGDYWDVYWGLTEAVRAAFAEQHVEMSYPHVNVHLDK